MRSLDKINEYVISVCEQIRWKKSHERISEEVFNHIIDGRDAYIKQGLDEQDATEKAITDSGDSFVIGTQLDRIHRPKPQWGMFLWVAGFLLLGVLLSQIIFPATDFPYSRFFTRLIWLVIGTVFMLVAYFADFSILGKYPWRIFITVTLFAVAVFSFIPAHAEWFYIPYVGAIHFRSIILVFPVILVPVIYSARNKGYRGLVISLVAYAFLCFIAATAPPPGLAAFAHFVPVGLSLIIFSVIRGWFGVKRLKGSLLVAVPHVAIFAMMLWVNGSGFLNRMAVMLNPHTDPVGRGFLSLQIRRLLSGAVLFGEGTPDQFYELIWPIYHMQRELYSDYLLTTVIYRFGWAAFAAILCAIIFFIAKAVARCFKQKSGLGFFVSLAIIMTFSMQVLTYIIFNFGFPIMIISLPLISPGNSTMVVNMVLIGFMLSVFRTGDAIVDKRISPSAKQSDFISWDNGTLTIRFKEKTE